MTRKLKLYLGGPINACTDVEASGWRERAAEIIDTDLIEILDPMVRDYRGQEDETWRQITDADEADLAAGDLILLYCWKQSAGSQSEMVIANRLLGKMVLAVVPEGLPVSPWVRRHCDILFRDIDLALCWVNELATVLARAPRP